MWFSCSLVLVLLALFPFVLVFKKSSFVVGVTSLVLFCRFFLFYFLFLIFCFVLFLLLFVVLPFAWPPGEGTRQRPDGGARQRFYCRPGVFFFRPSGFSFLFFSLLFVWFFFRSIYLLLALAVSLYISFSFVCLFLCFVTLVYIIFLICWYLLCSLSVFFLSFQCIGLAGVCMYAVPVIAQHNDMTLYYCCLPGTT